MIYTNIVACILINIIHNTNPIILKDNVWWWVECMLMMLYTPIGIATPQDTKKYATGTWGKHILKILPIMILIDNNGNNNPPVSTVWLLYTSVAPQFLSTDAIVLVLLVISGFDSESLVSSALCTGKAECVVCLLIVLTGATLILDNQMHSSLANIVHTRIAM